MTSSHQRIPYFLTRTTHHNQKNNINQIKEKIAPYKYLNGDKKWHVAFSMWHKYPSDLKQNRQFDHKGGDTIQDRRDIEPLNRYSCSVN